MVSGRRPTTDPLGMPLRILLWLPAAIAWVWVLCVPSVVLYGPVYLPRSFNVFGYDGFVAALYETMGSQIPILGGTWGAMLPVGVIIVLMATALMEGCGRRVNITWLRWGIAAPIALLLLATVVVAGRFAGPWEGWAYVSTNLLHRGHRLGRPNWPVLIPLIVGVCAVAWVIVAVALHRAPVSRSRRVRVGCASLAAVLWLAMIDAPTDVDAHTVRVLCEATLFWCFTATLIPTGSRLRDQPLAITRLLWRTPYRGEPLMYLLVALLGPVFAFGFTLVAIDEQRFATRFPWLMIHLPMVLYALQYVHFDMRRFRNHETFACARCRYDLRGTVAARRHACPECGHGILDDQHQWIAERMDIPTTV